MEFTPSTLVAIGRVVSYFVPISAVLALVFTALCFPRVTRPYSMTASAIAMVGGLAFILDSLVQGNSILLASYAFLMGFAFVGVPAALAALLVGLVIWLIKRSA